MTRHGTEKGIYKTDDGYGPLGRDAREFIALLRQQSYNRTTIFAIRRSISYLGLHMKLHNVKVSELTPQAIIDFVHALGSEYKKRFSKVIGRKFFAFLVERGLTAPAPLTPRQAAKATLRAEYEAYLRDIRGLKESSIYVCWSTPNRFIDYICQTDDICFLTIRARDVTDFLLQSHEGRPPSVHHRSAAASLRSFLRFLFYMGLTRRNFCSEIPKVAKKYRKITPHYLEPEQVDTLIEVARSSASEKTARRNYAMLLVLARMALRAQEAVAIRLDDIDWRAGEITIHGKGNRSQKMPLTQDVGAALVDYIKNERPNSTSNYLFVKVHPPFMPFKNGSAFNVILKENLARAGIDMPARNIGAHVLRHSLATRMVRSGASLDEVGDFLRHVSRVTTMLYAKLDHGTLRPVAQPWPGQGAGQ